MTGVCRTYSTSFSLTATRINWVCMCIVQLEKAVWVRHGGLRRTETPHGELRSNQSWHGLDLKQNQMTRIALHRWRRDLKLSECLCVRVSLSALQTQIFGVKIALQTVRKAIKGLSIKHPTGITFTGTWLHMLRLYLMYSTFPRWPAWGSEWSQNIGWAKPPKHQDRNICGEYLFQEIPPRSLIQTNYRC